MNREAEFYKKLYFMLFAANADAVELLENGSVQEATKKLIQAERDAEEVYISSDIPDMSDESQSIEPDGQRPAQAGRDERRGVLGAGPVPGI